MRVLGDLSALCAPRPTGVGNYVARLFMAMLQREDVAFRGVWNISRWRGGRHRHIPNRLAQCSLPRVPYLSGRLWDRADVYHGPDFRIPCGLNMARVVTVHDLACFHAGYMRDGFAAAGRARLLSLFKDKPDAILVPSAAVAVELLERFPEQTGRVHWVHHGCDHVPAVGEVVTKSRFSFPYFLCVGNVERRKNLELVAKAFREVSETIPEVRLVVAGKTGFAGDEVVAAVRGIAGERFIQLDWVSDDDLWQLYEHALSLVFVSHYEGFGFPVLEAMRRGCPVICGPTGAAAEAGGNAAMRLSELRQESLAEAMLSLSGEDVRRPLIQEGFRHAAGKTWAVCVEQTCSVYRAAIENRRGR